MTEAPKKRPTRERPEAVAYRPREAAEVLHIGLATLYRRIKAGDIKASKFGGATLIPYSEILRVSGGKAAEVTTRPSSRAALVLSAVGCDWRDRGGVDV